MGGRVRDRPVQLGSAHFGYRLGVKLCAEIIRPIAMTRLIMIVIIMIVILITITTVIGRRRRMVRLMGVFMAIFSNLQGWKPLKSS